MKVVVVVVYLMVVLLLVVNQLHVNFIMDLYIYNQMKNIDTNSTQLTSTYNDSEHTNDKYKQYLQNEEIPAMKISASAPNINANRVQINAPKPSRVILPTKTLSPSKKGRRNPKPLPKPQHKKHKHKHKKKKQ
eukprot:548984_1